jgi:hypothetical protein
MRYQSLFPLSSACAAVVLLAACGGGDDEAALAAAAEEHEAATAASEDGNGAAPDAVAMSLPPLGRVTADGTTICADRSIGAVQLDDLFVPDGRSCELDGTRFKGSIKVGTRSTLEAQRVRVNGNIQAEGSTLVRVIAGSTVGGSVQIKQGRAATINAARIVGDLQFEQQTRAVRANRNNIGGNLQAFGNTGGVTLNLNTMKGNLQCKENVPAPTGAGNLAASKEDQCRRL